MPFIPAFFAPQRPPLTGGSRCYAGGRRAVCGRDRRGWWWPHRAR
jgi:hypothetical protein